MSKPRTRHPNEPRQTWIDKKGRLRNGRSHHPIKYEDPEQANAAKHANGPEFPGADGPSGRMLAIIRSGAVLRPAQINGIRQSIVNVVEQNIDIARQVLEGTHVWTNTQSSLFLKLLDKVAPTMTESLHRHTMQPHLNSDYSRLTVSELEARLRDVLKEPEPDVIDVEPEPVKESQPASEERKAIARRDHKKRKLSAKANALHILETKEDPPPITRAEDNEKRRRLAAHAKAAREKAERRAIIKDLELMAQDDPKTPTVDPSRKPE